MTKISKQFPDSEFVKQYIESRADNVSWFKNNWVRRLLLLTFSSLGLFPIVISNIRTNMARITQ